MNLDNPNSSRFEDFAKLTQNRRTTKDFNGTAVEGSDCEDLVRIAIEAPNHHMNEPWRFRILSQQKIQEWIEVLTQTLPDSELLVLRSALQKLKNVGAVIYVSVLRDANALVNEENYAAACAATQNILLGATAKGLLSFWSSNKVMLHPASMEFLKMNESERFVAGVWLGHGEKLEKKARTKSFSEICQIL